MPAIRRAYTGGLEAAFESRTGTAAGGGHYPMLLFLARLSVLWRRSQVVRQRSAKPPFVGSIPTGASLSHDNLGPPTWRPFSHIGSISSRSSGNPASGTGTPDKNPVLSRTLCWKTRLRSLTAFFIDFGQQP